jgi:hypothetical protein
MELKGYVEQPPPTALPSLENPFNGIERPPLVLNNALGLRERNPFNGIESQESTNPTGEDLAWFKPNPFNGIERARLWATRYSLSQLESIQWN